MPVGLGTAAQLFGARAQARLTRRRHIIRRIEGDPELKTLLAVALAVVIVAPAAADPLEIAQMPFVKARAYARAIDRYCFVATVYSDNVELWRAALQQDEATAFVDADRLEEDALLHLRGDYNACAPAMKFVETTITALPELQARMTALIEQRDIRLKAAAEAEAKIKTEAAIARQKQELAEAEATRARQCFNYAKTVRDDLKKINAEDVSTLSLTNKGRRKARLYMLAGWIRDCRPRLTAIVADPLLAEIDRQRAKK
jgi:hypothetical protein